MKSKVIETIKKYALLVGTLIYLYVGFVAIVVYYLNSTFLSEPKWLIMPMVLSSIFGAIYSAVNYKLLGRLFSKSVVNTFTVTLVITLLTMFIITLCKYVNSYTGFISLSNS